LTFGGAQKNMTIETEEQANKALQELSSQQIKRDEINNEFHSKMSLMKAEYQAQFAVLDEKIQQIFSDLEKFAENNRPDKTKTLVLNQGKISWRNSSSLIIDDEAEIVQLLLKLKLGRYLKQTIKLKRDALLADEGFVKILDGVQIEKKEFLSITPNGGKAIKKKLDEIAQ
jgi:phage host-nuclease inhibitor protein Gam